MTQLARIEKVVCLQSTDFFSRCRAEDVLRLSAIADERRIAPDEVVYRIDDAADRLYCVVHGAVRLERPGTEPIELGPLRSFGFRDILSGRLRTEDACAVDDTLVLAIESGDLFDLLSRNVDIVKALFRFFLDERV